MTSWIKLKVGKKLGSSDVKSWYACVRDHVPSGLLYHTKLPSQEENLESSYYHKQVASGAHTYVIPLVRDLVHHEVYQIAQAWDKQFPEQDFIIDYSQPQDHVQPQTPDVPESKIAQVMDAWCKRQHDNWMQDKLDKGWRYGTQISVKQKTHPWIQPYESLPGDARLPHMQAVKDLVQLLQDFGYVIKQKPQA